MLIVFRPLWPFGLVACIQAISAHADSNEQATHSRLQFRSALEGYRHFADESVRPWVETNAVVREIGGWRAYAAERSATTAEPPDESAKGGSQAPSSRPEGGPDPHAGHRSRP